MSQATKELHKYERVTTLRTIGGFDVDDTQYPDLYIRGGAIIKKSLWIYGDILAGNIESMGNTTVGGELAVAGNSQFDGNVNVDGVLTASDLIVSGKLTTEDLCVNNASTFDGESTFNGNVIFNGNVVGISISGDITVDDISILNDASIGNDMSVGNELTVSGLSQFDGNVNVDSKLTADDLCIEGSSIIEGESTFNGNVIFNGNVVGISISGDITVDDISILNDVSVGNDINIDGESTFNGNVIFNGNVVGISISGDITVDDISILNDASIGNDITISGTGQFDSNVNVDGQITTTELLVNGNTTIDGKLTVTGIIDPTGLVLDAQNSSPWINSPNKGVIWVKNSNPLELIFEDETGNAHTVTFQDSVSTENINVGGFSIINVDLVDGRDISVDGGVLDSHVSDPTVHFTEGSIDHNNIINVGTESHANIDAHITDSTVHFTEGSIDHNNITNVGTESHANIDAHIADSAVHFTEVSINHANIIGAGIESHANIDEHIGNVFVDDHTQYLLLAGRSGDQTIAGNVSINEVIRVDDLDALTSTTLRLGKGGSATKVEISNYGLTTEVKGTFEALGSVTLGEVPNTDVITVAGRLSVTGFNGPIIESADSFLPVILDNEPEDLAEAGVISGNTYYTSIDTTSGGGSYTLADGGVNGQLKVIRMIADGSNIATITPTTFVSGTSITLNNVGDEVELMYNGFGWRLIKNLGATITA